MQVSPQASPLISIILPCRNEEESLQACLEQIRATLVQHNITGEVIISDSSSDRSPQIAAAAGARIIKHDQEGYGIAYQEGFKVARGQYLFCADPDSSYDFREIPRFLTHLQSGCDIVIGNRFAGIEPGAMPWLHQYVGNPLLSFMLRRLYRVKIHDAQCGMRALTRRALQDLSLSSSGMEYASEMIIKAARRGLTIGELPIRYYPRRGESKLRPFPDGWRHIRLILSMRWRQI